MLEDRINELTTAVENLTIMIERMLSGGTVPAPSADSPAPAAEAVAPDLDEATDAILPTEQEIKDKTLAMSRAGHKDAIRAKLDEIGVQRIGQLTKDQGVAFFAWLGTL